MKRVIIANFYPVWPPIHGGQRRIFYLARELSGEFDVEIVTPDRSGITNTVEFSSSFRECRVAVGRQFSKFEAKLQRDVKMSSDLSYAMHWKECIEYQKVLTERLAVADVAITAHPYSILAIRSALRNRDIPVIFDSQNVEARQKLSVLKDFPVHMEVIRGIERMALEQSDLTLACSEADALAFGEDYGIDPSKIVIIENGVDALGVPHVPSEVLAQLRSRLGLEQRLCAVFGGSFHHPNFLAAERILGVAQQVPDIIFVILGSVCNHPMFRNLSAANVRRLGQVEESVKWMAFQAADLGLNPMELGSGTNIKMFEYAASALPAVSTGFGARGIPLEPETEYLPAEIEDLPRLLGAMSIADRERLADIGQHARRKVRDVADWTVIGLRYRDAVRDVCA